MYYIYCSHEGIGCSVPGLNKTSDFYRYCLLRPDLVIVKGERSKVKGQLTHDFWKCSLQTWPNDGQMFSHCFSSKKGIPALFNHKDILLLKLTAL